MFATCANALLTCINQAGLKCKVAPVTAHTIAISRQVDEEREGVELLLAPDSKTDLTGKTLLDLVLHQHKDLLYLKSSNDSLDFFSTLFENERYKRMFERNLKEKSQQLFAIMSTPL